MKIYILSCFIRYHSFNNFLPKQFFIVRILFANSHLVHLRLIIPE